jgi:hypothetical protein
MRFSGGLTSAAVVSLLAIGCNGAIGDPVERGAGPPRHEEPRPTISVGATQLRPLNQREYTNTIHDLFGPDVDASELDLPPDRLNASGFDTDGAVAFLGESAAEQYLVAAERIASAVRERGIAEFAGCEASSALHACFDGAYVPWLTRAFRQPPPGESVERLRALVAGVESYGDAIEVVTVFTLVSPFFVFHYKSPLDRADPSSLDRYEIANRLAYFVWSSLPDTELLAAAADGSLLDASVRRSQAERMLADPRASRFVAAFSRLWLDVEAIVARAESDEEAALAHDMVTETMTFFADVFESGRIDDLIEADFSFVNARLATHYGIAAEGMSNDVFARVELPVEREGVLMHASLLAARSPDGVSDPIRRGVWIATQFLCAAPLVPPPDVAALEVPNEGRTVREVLAEHRDNPVCAACHRYTDPYGLALEPFDAAGVYRETYENGRAIDASGELATGETFADAYELNAILAARSDLERCVAKQLGTYALGRTLSTAEAELLASDLPEEDATFGDVVASVIGSPLFTTSEGSL